MKIPVTIVAVLAGLVLTAGPHASALGQLVVQEQNGVRFVSGGIGDTEQKLLENLAMGFNLKLVFANQQGKYLNKVRVEISDRLGTPVLGTVTDGPMLFADLLPGGYTVTTEFAGQRQRQEVQVGGGRRELVLRWSTDGDPELGGRRLIWERLDTDADGYISQSEARSLGLGGEVWERYDSNRDLRLDPEEFARFEIETGGR